MVKILRRKFGFRSTDRKIAYLLEEFSKRGVVPFSELHLNGIKSTFLRNPCLIVETVRRGFTIALSADRTTVVRSVVPAVSGDAVPAPVAAVEVQPSKTGDADYFWMPPEADIIRKALKARMNVLLVGPAGTGKSSMLDILVREINGQDPVTVNCHGDMSADDFIGFMVLKDGKTIFRKGPLPIAMEAGSVLRLEEMDALDPAVAFCMQRPLEGKGCVLNRKQAQEVQPKDGFLIAATANTVGKGDEAGLYQGVNVLNEAFLDRFGLVKRIGYPPESVEISILIKRTGISDALARQIAKTAGLARAAAEKGEALITFGMRKSMNWARLVVAGASFTDAFKVTVLERSTEENAAILAECFQRATGLDVKVHASS